MNLTKKFAVLFLGALAAYGQSVTISDTLTNAVGGGSYTGRITVTLNAPASSQPLYYSTTSLAGWQYVLCVGVTGADCTATTSAGTVAIPLYANSTITPSGTSYSARYQPAKGSPWSETWTVTASSTKLYQVRSTTVPSPTVTFQPSQISPGSSGQVLTTSGGAAVWAASSGGVTSLTGTANQIAVSASTGAVTISIAAPLTASGAIDFAEIPDGACLSNTLTLTGAALGDHLALGVSGTALPDGVWATARVSASNTAQVQVCNLSGAAVDLSSRTYSARIVR